MTCRRNRCDFAGVTDGPRQVFTQLDVQQRRERDCGGQHGGHLGGRPHPQPGLPCRLPRERLRHLERPGTRPQAVGHHPHHPQPGHRRRLPDGAHAVLCHLPGAEALDLREPDVQGGVLPVPGQYVRLHPAHHADERVPAGGRGVAASHLQDLGPADGVPGAGRRLGPGSARFPPGHVLQRGEVHLLVHHHLRRLPQRRELRGAALHAGASVGLPDPLPRYRRQLHLHPAEDPADQVSASHSEREADLGHRGHVLPLLAPVPHRQHGAGHVGFVSSGPHEEDVVQNLGWEPRGDLLRRLHQQLRQPGALLLRRKVLHPPGGAGVHGAPVRGRGHRLEHPEESREQPRQPREGQGGRGRRAERQRPGPGPAPPLHRQRHTPGEHGEVAGRRRRTAEPPGTARPSVEEFLRVTTCPPDFHARLLRTLRETRRPTSDSVAPSASQSPQVENRRKSERFPANVITPRPVCTAGGALLTSTRSNSFTNILSTKCFYFI